jgi:Ca2+-binding EF-hand superfamily protein
MTFTYPDGAPSVTITNLSEARKTPYYLLSVLKFSMAGVEEDRTVLHYWYDTWPDHGVPRAPTSGKLHCSPMLAMLADINGYLDRSGAAAAGLPTVIHCSAGIGRTGTLIAIDICTKQLRATGSVDVVAVVDRIRDDRGGLVQHEGQLTYLHAATRAFAHSRGVPAKAKRASVLDPSVGTITIAGLTVQFIAVEGSGEMTMADAANQGVTEAVFNLIDGDGDGIISKAEFRSFVAKTARVRRGSAKQRVKDSMGSCDTNQTTFPVPTLATKNVAPDELQFGAKTFVFLDVDGDGEMSMEEAALAGMPEAVFRRLDKDGNGTVSKAEFREFRQAQFWSSLT